MARLPHIALPRSCIHYLELVHMFLNISFRSIQQGHHTAWLCPPGSIPQPHNPPTPNRAAADGRACGSCGRKPSSPHPAGNHSPGVTQPTFRATYTADIFTLYFLLQCLSLRAIMALLNAKLNSQNPCPSFFQHPAGSQHIQSLLSGKAPNNFCTINFIY